MANEYGGASGPAKEERKTLGGAANPAGYGEVPDAERLVPSNDW